MGGRNSPHTTPLSLPRRCRLPALTGSGQSAPQCRHVYLQSQDVSQTAGPTDAADGDGYMADGGRGEYRKAEAGLMGTFVSFSGNCSRHGVEGRGVRTQRRPGSHRDIRRSVKVVPGGGQTVDIIFSKCHLLPVLRALPLPLRPMAATAQRNRCRNTTRHADWLSPRPPFPSPLLWAL